MPDQEPTLREVLARIDGLGARLDTRMGELREDMETLGRETRRELHGLPAQVADAVLKADVAELNRASGE